MLRVSFILIALLKTSTGCVFFRPPTPAPTPAPTPPPTPAPTPAPTQSPNCKCGVPQVSRNRIVGGQPATKNEYPWLVALVQTGSSRPFCGGTLISSKTVLTAAHCIVFSNSQFRVHVGEHDVTRADGEQKIGVSRQTQHPQYNANTQDNDFAVIELASAVTFSDTIMPVCLPSVATNYDNRATTTAGWGTFFSGSSSVPTTPYEVDVSTITNTACTTNTLYSSGEITSNMICAREAGKDACQGDSGGPLMTKESNFFSLVGVVSWGIGCAQSNAPGVYARVTSQLGWINGNTKGDTCPRP